MCHVDRGRCQCLKFINIVQNRDEDARAGNDPFGDAVGQSYERGLLAMNQEYASADRSARRNPPCKLRAVGMSGVFVDVADAGGDLDFVALDANGLRAVLEESAERSLGLKSD